MEKIGIEIKIDVIPGSSLKQAKANGKVDFLEPAGLRIIKMLKIIYLFFIVKILPDGPNYTHFTDSVYDKLYKNSISITDKEITKQSYSKMDSIITSKAVIVPLFYDEVIRFVSKDVIGMKINPTNLLDLRKVRKIN